MVLENFKLIKVENQQIIEIDYRGEILDLHNAAEFLKIDYIIKTSMLTLLWKYHFNGKNIILFQIKFEDVIYFEVFPRDREMPKEEDDCLEEIIYDEKLEFRFMGGMKIIVEADKVSFEKIED